MAIDLSSYDLPLTPSASTGLYHLPEDEADYILRYAAGLWAAYQAGVASPEMKNPRTYLPAVIRRRVHAANAGGAVWAEMRREMQRDMDAWPARVGDRVIRAIRRELDPKDGAKASAVMAIRREAMALDEAQLERLERAFRVAEERDAELAREALPTIPFPHRGSLRERAVRLFDAQPGATEVRKVFQDLPIGARHAAMGAYLGDGIEAPYRAILCGPWDEVVNDLPTTLYPAWTDEARRLRENFLNLPREARVDPDVDF